MRSALMRSLAALMADVAVVPVVEFKTNWAISDQVKGVTWHPDNSIHWYDYSPAN